MGALALIGSELVFFGLSLTLMQAALRWRRQGGLFAALPWGLLPALFMAGYLFKQLNGPGDAQVSAARSAWTQRSEAWAADRFPKSEQQDLRSQTRALALDLFEVLPALEFCMRMVLLAALAVLLRRRAQRQGHLPPAEALLKWTAPLPLIWLVLGPAFVHLGERHGLYHLQAVHAHLIWNLCMVGLAIYLFQGLVVFGAKLTHWSKDPRTRGLAPLALAAAALALLLLNGQAMVIFLVFTGLFEPWMDLRRLSFKGGDNKPPDTI